MTDQPQPEASSAVVPASSQLPPLVAMITAWMKLTPEQQAAVPPEMHPNISELPLWPGVSILVSQSAFASATPGYNLNLEIQQPTKPSKAAALGKLSIIGNNGPQPLPELPDPNALSILLRRIPAKDKLIRPEEA